MPKAKDFELLTLSRQRAYRAVWSLYKRNGASPSQAEISRESGLLEGNLHPLLFWLQQNGWISKKEHQHRSIVPLVRLNKKQETA